MNKFERRCDGCLELEMKYGKMTCRECFNQPCAEIDDCPCGVSVEEVEEIDEKRKNNKVKVVARAEKTEKTEKKPRNRKENAEKMAIISEITASLTEKMTEIDGKIEIVNPEREVKFTIGENTYSVTLICHRKPKA